jgi:hypothetical protein
VLTRKLSSLRLPNSVEKSWILLTRYTQPRFDGIYLSRITQEQIDTIVRVSNLLGEGD